MNCPVPPRIAAVCLLLGVATVTPAAADSLDLTNGDHFRGTVVSVTQSNIEFQSETLGQVTLPRSKVAHINLGEMLVPKPSTNGATAHVGPSLILQGTQNLQRGPFVSGTMAPSSTLQASQNSDSATAPQADAVLQQMRQEGIDPALVSQVKQQVFGQGNPVASQKFDELMGGLMSGNLSVGDIRAQAQESIKQIKDAKQQLGPDVGDLFDGYLSILESFVAETATNTTVTSAASSPAPAATTSQK
jgi:hypothetical protein